MSHSLFRGRMALCRVTLGLIGVPLAGQIPTTPQATVYRDPYGVPHIEAEDEETAWFALGYEEARDALLLIQVSAKRVRGQAVKYLVDMPGRAYLPKAVIQDRLLSDMLVQILGTYPQNLGPQQLRPMFAANSNPSSGASFYENCVAFAAGVNGYREKVRDADTPGSPEYDLKYWLDHAPFAGGTLDLSWVYEDEVSPLDFLWFGRWITAYFDTSIARKKTGYINAVGGTATDKKGKAAGRATSSWSQADLIEPFSSATGTRLFDQLKREIAGLPGAGSNAFGWTKEYCRDPYNGAKYAGLMADPHDANFSSGYAAYGGFLGSVFGFEPLAAHTWFAHVRVASAGSPPKLDAYGTIPHGMASFFTAHNQNIAWGGSLGAPNVADAFLLRLKEDPNTGMASSSEYYDYYQDPDGSDGSQGSDWSPLTTHSCAIERSSGGPLIVNYFRAGSFGFVLPDMAEAMRYLENPASGVPSLPVVYGEFPDAESRLWRMKVGQAKMRFCAEPDPADRDPMVVALRVPLDAAVSGESFHWMYPRDAWEFAHAASVTDVLGRLNEQAAGYPVNFCCVDRNGRLLATMLGAIPKRGDYSIGSGAGPLTYQYGPQNRYTTNVHSFPDLWFVYSGLLGPVPARMHADKVFDWQFATQAPNGHPMPGTLRYLDASIDGGTTSYKAKFHYVAPGVSFPPVGEAPMNTPPSAWWVDNAGFASMCNATPWQASRKVALAREIVPPPSPDRFNVTTADNPILQAVLDAGTAYQAFGFAFEAPDRNQMVIDHLTDIAKNFSSDPAVVSQARPLMTVDGAREFVVTPDLYAPDEVTTTAGVAGLPTAIRIQKEILENIGTGGTDHAGNGWPREEADKEARFFHDLWDVLVDPSGLNTTAHQYWRNFRAPGQPSNLSLKQIWIDNAMPGSSPGTRAILWYHNPGRPNQTVLYPDMPAGFALIDFQWNQSMLGPGSTVGYVAPGVSGFDGSEIGTFGSLVDFLVKWGGPQQATRFPIAPDSPAALLYETWRRKCAQSRTWLPLSDGLPVLHNGSPRYCTSPDGDLMWAAFPLMEQLQTARQTWVPVEIPLRVYQALYQDTAAWRVKDGHTSIATHYIRTEDLNELTQFFLRLGGFFVEDSDTTNGGNPSRKLAMYKLAEARAAADPALDLREEMLKNYPAGYPLTANLARMTAPRRLIEAGSSLGGLSAIRNMKLSDRFGTRLCDFSGVVRWPTGPGSPPYDRAPCWGGQMCGVEWVQDPNSSSLGFIRIGSSNHPLLTLFPDNGGDPRSYFWADPGVRLMAPSDPTLPAMMPDMADNRLMETYFSTSRYRNAQFLWDVHQYTR